MKKIIHATQLLILINVFCSSVYSQNNVSPSTLIGEKSKFEESGVLNDQTWIDLDGANDFLDFGTDSILAGKTQFTVEMRMHFDNSSGDYTIIGQRTSDLNRTIVLQRWAGSFYIFLSSTNWGTCAFIPCEGMIYHLAIVYNGAGAYNTDRLKLYINGVSQSMAFSGTVDVSSSVTSPAANLVLGCEHNDASTQLQFVDGQFGEFCVWDYPLSSTEINDRIIPEVSGTETGLMEYFHFDNGTPGGNNIGITSFTGGKSLSTITPKNMTMNGATSNFVGFPILTNTIDTTVTTSGVVIASNATGATYQWLDCNNGYSIIPSANSQSYTATANGSYAVKLMQGSCTDTSECIQISSVGIVTLETGNMVVYPNPVLDELIIENRGKQEKTFYEILNSTGQVILSDVVIEKNIVRTADLPAGIYLLKLHSEKSFEYKKIIKN